MTISIKDYRFGHARVGVVHIIGPPPFDEAKAFKVYIASYLKIDLEINQSRLLDHYYSKLNFCIGLPSWNDDALVDIISCVGGVELINLLTFAHSAVHCSWYGKEFQNQRRSLWNYQIEKSYSWPENSNNSSKSKEKLRVYEKISYRKFTFFTWKFFVHFTI